MADTKIEWATKVWNPTTGCTRVTRGCHHCYMFSLWPRLHGMKVAGYEGPPERLAMHPERLQGPMAWKKPQRIFVNSMSDLFHRNVKVDFISEVWETMARCPQHTFMILTKRPHRMDYWLNDSEFRPDLNGEPWPLRNVWLGTSVEDQLRASRIDALSRTPAVIRFVSAEPLIGPLDLRTYMWWADLDIIPFDVREGMRKRALYAGINWVIAGGESGPKGTPAHPRWFRDLRDHCVDAGVPFFFKQWGSWRPLVSEPLTKRHTAVALNGWRGSISRLDSTYHLMGYVGKGAAGAVLDGREWRQIPEVNSVVP